MIDHLIKSADEPAMIGLLPQYRVTDEGGNSFWRSDILFPCQVLDTTTLDADGNPTPLPYFYLWIALPEEDPILASLPECVIIADRDAAQAGKPFVLWATLDATQLDIYTVAPTVLGSSYPFGRP